MQMSVEKDKAFLQKLHRLSVEVKRRETIYENNNSNGKSFIRLLPNAIEISNSIRFILEKQEKCEA